MRDQRDALIKEQLIAAVERHTGRRVRMLLSGILGESWVDVRTRLRRNRERRGGRLTG